MKSSRSLGKTNVCARRVSGSRAGGNRDSIRMDAPRSVRILATSPEFAWFRIIRDRWRERRRAVRIIRRTSGSTANGDTTRTSPVADRTTSRSLFPTLSGPLYRYRSASRVRVRAVYSSARAAVCSAAVPSSSTCACRACSATTRGFRARYRFGRSRVASIHPFPWRLWRTRYTAGYWTPRRRDTSEAVETPRAARASSSRIPRAKVDAAINVAGFIIPPMIIRGGHCRREPDSLSSSESRASPGPPRNPQIGPVVCFALSL